MPSPVRYVDPELPQRIENAAYQNAIFDGRVSFKNRIFEGRADFAGCVFKTKPDFSNTTFRDRAFFTGAVFEDGADFYDSVFEKFANFGGVEVTGTASFTGATFANGLSFENVKVSGELRLNRAFLDQTSLIGPVEAARIDLRLSVFQRRVRLELHAGEIDCERARFLAGVRLLTGGEATEVDLTDTELGGASLVAPLTPDGARPRITSLTGTDVSSLTLAQALLWDCRMLGAHNLDKLRVEGADAFPEAPRRIWATKRITIWDEHLERATRTGLLRSRRWQSADVGEQSPGMADETLQAYRALRKGCEDAKDQTWAADFYYGEMEMRRAVLRQQAKNGRGSRWIIAHTEHLLLWLYWLISGYGLRAWRAFSLLGIVVALTAAGFLAWGFPPGSDLDYADSVRFSLRAATSILRAPEQKLTATGEWIELALRFIGPVLFGLAILALRGRVRR